MKNLLEKVKLATLAMQRHSWEQGVVAQAFLEMGNMDMVQLLVMEAVNRQGADGRCAQMGRDGSATDGCCIGEALITTCERMGNARLVEAKDKLIEWALRGTARNENGIVYHLTDRKEFWVDSFYMLPPFLARVGYYDEAIRQMNGYWDALFDSKKGLLSHRWDDERKVFVRKDVWGVGNGWAMAGMARVIAMLPEVYAEEKRVLIERIRTLIDSALPFICDDGMFHDVIDCADTFKEVNFGQMMAYTIYRGVKEKWLEEKYLGAAEACYAAAVRQVDEYGFVMNVCGAPHFDRPGVAPEGQAFFMLMCAMREAYME